MRFTLLFFLLLLGVFSLSLAQGTYEDCCLKFVVREIPSSTKKRVTSYRTQEQDGGCNLSAIVFKLKRGREFCTRPVEKWVQELMKQIDKNIQHKTKKRNKQGRH